MRNTQNQSKNRKQRPAWVEMFAKTQSVGASGNGRDWHTDVPNIKLSRAFVVVLVLHVVAVGGILAFEMFKPENSAAEVASTGRDKIEQISADTPAPAAVETTQRTPAVEREDRRGGYERYIVQAGDRISTIAERYRIARTELLAANRIDEQHPLVAGRILRVPKALLPGGSSANIQPVSVDIGPSADTPPVSSSLGGSDLLSETMNVEPEDDGFLSIGSVPTTSTPASESTASPEPAPETRPEPARDSTVASGGYQPATINRDEEDATPRIVAPREPKVSRKLPTTQRNLPAATTSSTAGRSHSVVAGETLYRISRKYSVSVDEILKANPGVKPSTLAIGKTLRIP